MTKSSTALTGAERKLRLRKERKAVKAVEDFLMGEKKTSSFSTRESNDSQVVFSPSPNFAGGDSTVSSSPNSGFLAAEKTSSEKISSEKTNSEKEIAEFDPFAPELQTTWSTYAEQIYCLNTYPNGITLSVHSNDFDAAKNVSDDKSSDAALRLSKYLPNQFHLRFRDTRDYQLPVGKYYLHRENYAAALEAQLSHLHKVGELNSMVCYFGSVTDPFLNLHKKFDVTMSCLDVLERYAPGLVVFQTRSPMVISILPALKALGSRAVVAIPIETHIEKSVQRYMPTKPRVAERIVAADGLRKQGVTVNLMASPVLPYGDYFRDAWDFADLLNRHADYITFGSLASGSENDEKALRIMPIAQKLVADKQFRYLRPYSYHVLYRAMQAIAPEKLLLPVKKPVNPSQLSLFTGTDNKEV